MGLLSLFQRQTDPAGDAPAAEPDAVAAGRTRPPATSPTLSPDSTGPTSPTGAT